MKKDAKKQIMLFIPTLTYGGSQRAICSISRLIKDDFNVCLTTFSGKDCAYEYGGELIDLSLQSKSGSLKKALLFIHRTISLKKLISYLKIDLVVSFTGTGNNYATIACRRKKHIISVRGYEDLIKNEEHLIAQAKKSDGVIFNSEDSKQYFVSQHNELGEKCISINNCFDLEQLRKDALGSVDEKFSDFCNGKKVIIAVGRLCKVKGFDILIKAFLLLREQRDDCRLVIIGDGEEMASLQAVASASSDILLAGAKDNPMPYLAAADIYVLPSRHEGFPNVVIEAMSAGLPVICSNCRSGPNEILNRDYVPNRVVDDITLCDYGILVPPAISSDEKDVGTEESCKVLSDAISLLLENEPLRIHYKALSLKRANDFSFDASRQKYIQLINGLLNRTE